MTSQRSLPRIFDSRLKNPISAPAGNRHLPVMNESVLFVMPLDSALQQLQQEAFHSYLVTIECNTVSIFIESNSPVKVLDSHYIPKEHVFY